MKEAAMPSEFRHVIFRPAEVVQAVQTYKRRINEPLPAGSILGCDVESEEKTGLIGFRITLAPHRPNRERFSRTERYEVVIDGPSLAAALILYCKAVRIPLPAKANKSLRMVDGHLCLFAAI
ncbi:MAG: hypothetical protein ACRYG8_45110 [Janthinobacterium lividum]